MKKTYIQPEIQIIELEMEGHILTVSGYDEPAAHPNSNKTVGKSNIWSTAIKPTHTSVWDKEW